VTFAGIWKSARRWLPGVLISVIALVIVFQIANWDNLTQAIGRISLGHWALGIGLTIISLITRAIAWRVLLGNKPTLTQSFFIVNEGYMLNNLLPLRAGEIARAVFMGKATGLGAFHVLPTILIERAYDVAAAATMLLLTLPLVIGEDWAGPVATVALVLVVIGLFILFLMGRYSEKVEIIFRRIAQRWGWLDRTITPKLSSLLEGMKTMTKPSQFLLGLFWIALSWVIWVFMYYTMLRTIAPQAQYWWSAFADAVLALGIALPSAPSAVGVFELAMSGALMTLGVPKDDALGYTLAMHFLQVAVTGFFGVWGLLREGKTLSAILADLRMKEPTAESETKQME
jgi:hypothetical protein